MAARVLCGEGRYDVKCKERQPWKTARPDAGLAIKSTSNLCPALHLGVPFSTGCRFLI